MTCEFLTYCKMIDQYCHSKYHECTLRAFTHYRQRDHIIQQIRKEVTLDDRVLDQGKPDGRNN
jgi:hypothetical protein